MILCYQQLNSGPQRKPCFIHEKLDIAQTWNFFYYITEKKKEKHGRKKENNTRFFWLHVSLLVNVCIFG